MNTQEVANRLVSLCREGKNMQALEELYSDNIVSKEMSWMPGEVVAEGKEAVTKKSQEWYQNVEEYHGGTVSDPLVAGNHFSCTMDMDVTFKDRGRQQMQEVCVYEVKDGKIVNEQFFYSAE
ncbi:nuclear transport factor 2 family protein [Mangrovimonas aestuarii]|uniref:nuclear transport factor 2 family protein n=1 Tax=Mangrovimonas aestuarii TaxID=3018443 RepID=UPI002378C284|nr:nuclear transport factor 2 family protein [Mangrovimonas aestuarii]